MHEVWTWIRVGREQTSLTEFVRVHCQHQYDLKLEEIQEILQIARPVKILNFIYVTTPKKVQIYHQKEHLSYITW